MGARSAGNPHAACDVEGAGNAARMQFVASQLQIESTVRGLLKVYGLKIGAIHRNRFAARVLELLETAALTELSAAIEPLLRVR